MVVRRHLIFFILCFFGFSNLFSQSFTYLKAVARPGETVYSFLDWYALESSTCNIEQFKKINKLSSAIHLKSNQVYLLPIYVCTYNGKSIRSTINIKDYDKAVDIKDYNEEVKKNGLRVNHYETSRILWVPFDALNCPKSKLPLRGRYAIFGKGQEKVYLKSQSLAGAVFYIISGHGGPDPGTIGKRNKQNLCEDEYAYDIALRLAKNLLAHKATAYLIVRDENDGIRNQTILVCDKDEYYWNNVPISSAQLERLKKRTDIVNKLYSDNKNKNVYYQRLLSIHIDSYGRDVNKDMYFNYKTDDSKSKNLANALQTTIQSKYKKHQKNRIYSGNTSERSLYILDNSNVASVLMELGNIKNTEDQIRLILPANRQAIADWLCEGLIKDFKNNK